MATLDQEPRSSTTLEHLYMKALTKPGPGFLHEEDFAGSRTAKLVGQWQHGIEMISGHAQWKLHLTLAHWQPPGFATVNHCQRL